MYSRIIDLENILFITEHEQLEIYIYISRNKKTDRYTHTEHLRSHGLIDVDTQRKIYSAHIDRYNDITTYNMYSMYV